MNPNFSFTIRQETPADFFAVENPKRLLEHLQARMRRTLRFAPLPKPSRIYSGIEPCTGNG